MNISPKLSLVDRGFVQSHRRGSHIQTTTEGSSDLRIADSVIRHASVVNPDFGGLQADSRDATLHETSMGVLQALKLYKKAVLWSVVISSAIIMEGYDVVLLTNFYALPAFNDYYGDELDPVTGKGLVSAPWRSALGNAALIGEIFGLMATGYLQDRFGYRRTIGGALILLTGVIFVPFFSVNLPMLLVGEILCGLPWGVFQSIIPAYASEIAPVKLRGYLTTFINLCWVIGQLISSGVARAMINRDGEWGYRIPFAVQWIWPIPILIGVMLAPESPWWLVRNERFEEAKSSLLRLTSEGDTTFDANKTVAMMLHTTEIERGMSKGVSYLDCFRGVNLRRTEICCFTWLSKIEAQRGLANVLTAAVIAQTICGATFMAYSTTFFQRAGLSTPASFDLSMGLYGIGACGTFASWFLMRKLGRRTIYLLGTSVMCLLLFIIGMLGLGQDQTSVQWTVGSILLVYAFVYDSTVGPICYSLVSELPSTQLKAKTIVLARCTYNIGFIVDTVITNYQLTATAWDWGAYSGFFWAGTCFVAVVWTYFRLPEPKNRTYGEIDILFEHKVSARKFKTSSVDMWHGDTIEVVPAEETVDTATPETDINCQQDEKGIATFDFQWGQAVKRR